MVVVSQAPHHPIQVLIQPQVAPQAQSGVTMAHLLQYSYRLHHGYIACIILAQKPSD